MPLRRRFPVAHRARIPFLPSPGASHGRRRRISVLVGALASLPLLHCAPAPASPHQVASQAAPLGLPSDTVLATETVNGLAVGTLSGQGLVRHGGTAAYSIPLWVPDGRAGMQPGLALQYDSGMGNGELGVGWSLSGLSRITRCRRTTLHEGADREIRFDNGDAGDRFCLDGQRLVLTGGPTGTSSTYGGHRSEYRTEQDAHIKVVSLSPDTRGPTSFKVFLKDGRILTMGGGVNASLEGPRASVTLSYQSPSVPRFYTTDYSQQVRWAWGVSRMEDRSGNSLRVDYRLQSHPSDPSAIEQLPDRIDYTASTADPQGTTTRSVRFQYEARPDPSDSFVGGFKQKHTQRLKRIEMWGPNPATPGLLRSYTLTYGLATLSQRSRLDAVQECDGTGVCLPGTRFTWTPGDATFTEIDTNIAHGEGHLLTGDINGDGRDDLIQGAAFFYLSTGTGIDATPRTVKYYDSHCPDGEERYLDIDGDDRLELVITGKKVSSLGGYQYRNCLYRPTASGSPTAFEFVDDAQEPWVHQARGLYVLDLNGDGFAEWVRGVGAYAQGGTPGQTLGYRLNNAGTLASYVTTTPRHENNVRGYAVDVNGSGKSSLLLRSTGVGFQAYGLEGTTNTVVTQPLSLAQDDGKQYYFADVTGDGLMDAVAAQVSQGQLRVAVNTGHGFAEPVAWNVGAQNHTVGTLNLDDSGVRVVDYNGDGRHDLLLMGGSSDPLAPMLPRKVTVLVSTGTGFTQVRLPFTVGSQFPGTATEPAGWDWSNVLDVNGDGQLDFVQVVNGTLHVYVRQGTPGDLLTRVDDGLGAFERFEYAPLSDALVYTPAQSCAYPTRCACTGLWLVRLHEQDSGLAQPRAMKFTYQDGRFDRRGRGWLGFARRVEQDLLRLSTRTATYDNVTREGTFYTKAGLPLEQRTVIPLEDGGTYEVVTSSTYKADSRHGGKVLDVYPETLAWQEKEGGHLLFQGQKTRAQDAYGNVTSLEELTDEVVSGAASGNRYRMLTTAQFDTSESDWLISQQRRLSQTHTILDGGTRTRVVEHDYYPVTGLLQRTRVEPTAPSGVVDGGSELLLTTTYERDAGFGLVSAVVSEGSGQVRTERIAYDDLDQTYPKAFTNALGHTQELARHPGLGVVGAVQDPNGVQVKYRYDGLGRLRFEDSPDSADVTYSHLADATGRPKVSASVKTGPATSRSAEITYDRLGREVLRRWQGFDGAYVVMEQVYDAKGRPVSRALPHLDSAPAVSFTSTYDNLDRPLREQHPDGTFKERRFSGRYVTSFDEKRNTTVLQFDDLKRVSGSADFELEGGGPGVYTYYTYGPFGVMTGVRQPGGVNTTSFEYDVRGRRVRMVDPDAGDRRFNFNAFGESKDTRDAMGALTTYTRDALGRITQVDKSDGRSNFTWDTALHGIGKVAVSTNASHYAVVRMETTFDALSRPKQTAWIANNLLFLADIDRTYDAYGRLQTLTYPAVTGRARLQVERLYNDRGYLRAVQDPATQHLYWEAQAYNAYGQLTTERMGNAAETVRQYDLDGKVRSIRTTLGLTTLQDLAYTYEPNGNLSQRQDLLAQTVENFTYDRLDRLTTWKVAQGGSLSELRYHHAPNGNLLDRTVVSGPGSTVTYGYGSGAGPHAVTSMSQGGVTSSYTYDANGRQLTGAGRQVSYTSFDLPASLSVGGQSTLYFYDANRQRVGRSTQGSTTDQTLYAGEVYEQRRRSSTVEHVFKIHGADRQVAQVVWTQSGGTFQPDQELFLHVDPLGSTETVTNAQGAVEERMKFDPFGSRRSPASLTTPISPPFGAVHLGFTGHEPDAESGLINMKGRMYDPVLGRFLSADPHVTYPHFGQSYNRYSYVLNNPLAFVDPTGFDSTGSGDGPSGGGGDGTSGPGSSSGGGSYSGDGPTYGPQGDGSHGWGETGNVTGPSTGCAGCGRGRGAEADSDPTGKESSSDDSGVNMSVELTPEEAWLLYGSRGPTSSMSANPRGPTRPATRPDVSMTQSERAESWAWAFEIAFSWATGTGARELHFNADSVPVKAMRSSMSYINARNEWMEAVDMAGGKFHSLRVQGRNETQGVFAFVIGHYRATFSPNPDGKTMTVTIWNRSSWTSYLHKAFDGAFEPPNEAPNWDRSESEGNNWSIEGYEVWGMPFANVYQVFSWQEPLPRMNELPQWSHPPD
ncbi:hypothetical protein D7Y21_09840 [Corallococcus sp. AB045]|nr:hypothetical protein D7Y21_09840 [Corallococcus sp. AB045]